MVHNINFGPRNWMGRLEVWGKLPPRGDISMKIIKKKSDINGLLFCVKEISINLRMRRETGKGVLSRLKRRFAPLVGQNALYFKNTNSVIMLN